MITTQQQPELRNGDRMSRDEFLSRWEQIPDLKNAELINGVVYLASPVSRPNGTYDALVAGWLGHYAYLSRQDLDVAVNMTIPVGDSAFQPDVALFRTNAQDAGSKYLTRLPDLAVEICYSSQSYDLGPKLAAYRTAGLREYITVLLQEQRVEWRVLSGTRYRTLQPSKAGMLRSTQFPGLWLDAQALFPPDRQRLFRAVEQSLAG